MDGSRRVTITIAVLGLLIATALVAWTSALFKYFDEGNTWDDAIETVNIIISDISDIIDSRISKLDVPFISDDKDFIGPVYIPEVSVSIDVPAIPAPTLPPPITPIPTDRGNNEDVSLREASVANISEVYPDLYNELDSIARQYGNAAISLVAYDAHLQEYFTYEYGYADINQQREVSTDTKFYMASLTKLVTATCVMTLVDDGYIDLDTDISTYFGYEVRNPHFPDTKITTRMLMQHTSSLFDSGAFQTSRDRGTSESVKYLIEQGTSFRRNRPGTKFEYSNFGYAVLGALCERVSGLSLDTYAREVIFIPLGIDAAYVPANLDNTDNIAVIYDSSHAVSRSVEAQLDVRQSTTLGYDIHLAQGNLTISAVDYAKFLSIFDVDEEVMTDSGIVSSGSVNVMHRADIEGSDYFQGLATRYSKSSDLPGYEWLAEDEGIYWHTGSSYGIFSQYVYSQDRTRGVVVVTSGAAASRLENGMIDVCTDLTLAAWKVFS